MAVEIYGVRERPSSFVEVRWNYKFYDKGSVRADAAKWSIAGVRVGRIGLGLWEYGPSHTSKGQVPR